MRAAAVGEIRRSAGLCVGVDIPAPASVDLAERAVLFNEHGYRDLLLPLVVERLLLRRLG
jgi:hypothetical protein